MKPGGGNLDGWPQSLAPMVSALEGTLDGIRRVVQGDLLLFRIPLMTSSKDILDRHPNQSPYAGGKVTSSPHREVRFV